jgi:hypothetical protein
MKMDQDQKLLWIGSLNLTHGITDGLTNILGYLSQIIPMVTIWNFEPK